MVDYSSCPDSGNCLDCKYEMYDIYIEETCDDPQHPDKWGCVHAVRQDWVDNSPFCDDVCPTTGRDECKMCEWEKRRGRRMECEDFYEEDSPEQ